MTRTDLIKNLEYTKSKYKDKFVGTGEINIYEMVSDVLGYLNQPTTEINIDYYEELKRLARIGKATEKAFGFSECDDYLAQANKSHKGEFVITGEVFGSLADLIDWAESDGE